MKVSELVEALSKYNPEAQVQVGLSIPTLFINTSANLSISGNAVNPESCEILRLIACTPDVRPQC